MRLVISSDHAGFPLKEEVRASLAAAGHEVVDLGPFKVEPEDDYPDFAAKIGSAPLFQGGFELLLRGSAEARSGDLPPGAGYPRQSAARTVHRRSRRECCGRNCGWDESDPVHRRVCA